MNWTPDEYDRLERALDEGHRLQIWRRGTEYVVIPERLRPSGGDDVLTARSAATGDRLEFRLRELDRFAVLD